jgi:branched-chain amino acid transport system permease protein
MVGAYLCLDLMMTRHVPFVPALLLTLVGAALLGVLIERVVLRPLLGSPVISVIMVTLGLASVLRSLLQIAYGPNTIPFPEVFPTDPVKLGAVPVSLSQLYAVGCSALLLVILTIFFNYTKTGLALRATALNRQVALSMGVSVRWMFALAWLIAAVVSAVGGVLLGSIRGGIDMSLGHMGLKVLPVVILGGLDSLAGAIVGGLIIGLLENITGGYLDPLLGGGVKEVVPAVALVLILMIRPSGLFGTKKVDRV